MRLRRSSISSLTLLPLLIVFAAACGDAGDAHDDETAAFEEAYAQAELGKSDTGGCSGVVVPDKSGFAKRVALTFDDGPNPATTPQVLDLLAQHGIKATFFVNGSRIRSDAERAILKRILAEGHILGNHSQNHLNLKNVSAATLASEVDKTHQELVAAGATPRYFRFPFGSASCDAMRKVGERGYLVTGWHIDSADWCYAKSGTGYCSPSTFQYVPDRYRRDLLGYVMSQVRAKEGGVVLFHDVHPNTLRALPAILETLEDEGYAFVQVDSPIYFPRLNQVTPPAQRFVGDACTSDLECNFAGKLSSAVCHRFHSTAGDFDAGFCSIPCEGTCPDKSGWAPTFCTSLDSGFSGRCVSKSHALNGECANILGTGPKQVSRFIGGSGSAAATATACVPQ